MRATVIATCVVFGMLGQARPAQAGWLLTPFAGVASGRTGYFNPDDAAKRIHPSFGVAVTKMWGRWGVEGDIAAVPAFFTGPGEGLITSSGVLSVSANGVLGLPALGRVRPYATAGLGAVRVTMEDAADLFPTSEWQPAMNAGAGVMVPVSGRMSLRGDARVLFTRRGDGSESPIGFGDTYVDLWRVTAGLAIAIR
jgi:opacity protein-like surface antigen